MSTLSLACHSPTRSCRSRTSTGQRTIALGLTCCHLRQRGGGLRSDDPLSGLEHLACQARVHAAPFRREAMLRLEKAPETMAFPLRLTFALSCHGLAEIVAAAPGAADDDTCATPPEVGGARPVALHKVERGQVVERQAHVGVVGAQRFLADAEGASVVCLRLGVAALLEIQVGQVVERRTHIGWSGPSAFSLMASDRL